MNPRMPEESHPQLKVISDASRRIHARASLFPKVPAPKRRLLHNVAVSAGQKSVSGPPRNVQHSDGHPLLIQPCRASRDPIDLRQVAKHAAYHGETSRVECIGRADPAHDLSGGTQKAFVERIVHASIWLADPTGNIVFMLTNDINRTVR